MTTTLVLLYLILAAFSAGSFYTDRRPFWPSVGTSLLWPLAIVFFFGAAVAGRLIRSGWRFHEVKDDGRWKPGVKFTLIFGTPRLRVYVAHGAEK